MQHLAIIAGEPSRTRIIGDRITGFFSADLALPAVKRREMNDEGFLQTLILASSSEHTLPKVYLDKEAGIWLVTIGAWFIPRGLNNELATSLKDICQAENLLNHKLFQNLDAAFCIACGEVGKRHFRVVTDRVGTQHVYWHEFGSAQAVSTSALSLAKASEASWDISSVQEFLSTGSVFGTRSLFQDIAKIPGATQATFSAGKSKKFDRYWRISDCQRKGLEDQSSTKRLAEALQASIELSAEHFGTPALDLTGGLDSRAIFAAALRARISFETVTVGDAESADVVIAKQIAKKFGVQHHHIDPSPVKKRQDWFSIKSALLLCEGEYDVLEYARIFKIHDWLSRRFDFSLNGSGGEFCKGYWWELLWPGVGQVKPLDVQAVVDKRFQSDAWESQIFDRRLQVDIDRVLVDTIESENTGLTRLENTLQMDNVYLTLRMQRWQGRIASATNQIWPTISPFMFKEPMDIAFSTLPKFRLRNRMSRGLNEYLNPELARISTDQLGPALPLRFDTAAYFLPMAWSIFERTAKKAMAKMQPGGVFQNTWQQKYSAASISDYEGLDQIKNIGNWHTQEFYDLARLGTFINEYVKYSKPLDSHFGRVISLELVARLLDGKLR